MGRNGMGRKQRAALRRIVALMLALADLAERAAGRSLAVRWLVLSILGVTEPVARTYVARLTGIPSSYLTTQTSTDRDDIAADRGVARAYRLAFAFRILATILAAALAGLPDDATRAVRTGDIAAAFRDLMAARQVECRDSS